MEEITKVYLNTWGAYNNGCIGYGWMTTDEAKAFIEKTPERDGGEWFIADIDNYTGYEFENLNYSNVYDVIRIIETLENMDEEERREVVALMEYLETEDIAEAVDSLDCYTFYEDIDSYYDMCDELIDEQLANMPNIRFYFDYSAYHRDCDYDVHEMSNGVVIAA